MEEVFNLKAIFHYKLKNNFILGFLSYNFKINRIARKFSYSKSKSINLKKDSSNKPKKNGKVWKLWLKKSDKKPNLSQSYNKPLKDMKKL